MPPEGVQLAHQEESNLCWTTLYDYHDIKGVSTGILTSQEDALHLIYFYYAYILVTMSVQPPSTCYGYDGTTAVIHMLY